MNASDISPLVSILIPCYNSECYIKETLSSCIGQTYEYIEVIVVDDGSTDDSLKIVQNIALNHKNIFVYTQENQGAPAARNLAFEKSSGQYVQYLDADDILDKTKIENQINLLNENKDSVVFGNCKLFYNDIVNSFEYNPKVLKDYKKPKDLLIDLWSNATSIYIHTWLVPRNLVRRVNGWDEEVLKNQDGVFFAKIVSASKKVLFDDSALVYCRLDNAGSISRKKFSKSEESRLKSFEKYEELFTKELSEDRVKKALAIQYSYFIFDNYPDNKDLCKIAQKKIEFYGFKEPVNLDIKIYKVLSPVFGIYNAIYIHKRLSNFKQYIKGLIK